MIKAQVLDLPDAADFPGWLSWEKPLVSQRSVTSRLWPGGGRASQEHRTLVAAGDRGAVRYIPKMRPESHALRRRLLHSEERRLQSCYRWLGNDRQVPHDW